MSFLSSSGSNQSTLLAARSPKIGVGAVERARVLGELDNCGYVGRGNQITEFTHAAHFSSFWGALVDSLGKGRDPLEDGILWLPLGRLRTTGVGVPTINDRLRQYQAFLKMNPNDRQYPHGPRGSALKVMADDLTPLAGQLAIIRSSEAGDERHDAMSAQGIFWCCHNGLMALRIWDTVKKDPKTSGLGLEGDYDLLRSTLVGWSVYLQLGEDLDRLAETDLKSFAERISSS